MKRYLSILKLSVGGFLIGVINGLFGAGGGMLAVPLFKAYGMEQKKAHANSIAVILPLCLISVCFYFMKGNVDIKLSLYLIPFGLIGAAAGTLLMRRIDPVLLKHIFAVFLIWAGLKMFLG